MILLLSDNDKLIQKFEEDLKNEGFEVKSSKDFTEVLFAINGDSVYESILLDFDYSKQDVFEVCQKIKRHPSLQYSPLICVVEKSRMVDQLLAFEMGVDDFIHTPYSQLEIQLKMRSVQRLIDLQKQLRQKDTQLENLKNIQRVMVTLNHYINNALTPLYFAVQIMDEDEAEGAKRIKDIARETVEFISKVLKCLNKIVQSGQIKVVREGVYKDIMFDIDKELNKLLEKTKQG